MHPNMPLNPQPPSVGPTHTALSHRRIRLVASVVVAIPSTALAVWAVLRSSAWERDVLSPVKTCFLRDGRVVCNELAGDKGAGLLWACLVLCPTLVALAGILAPICFGRSCEPIYVPAIYPRNAVRYFYHIARLVVVGSALALSLTSAHALPTLILAFALPAMAAVINTLSFTAPLTLTHTHSTAWNVSAQLTAHIALFWDVWLVAVTWARPHTFLPSTPHPAVASLPLPAVGLALLVCGSVLTLASRVLAVSSTPRVSSLIASHALTLITQLALLLWRVAFLIHHLAWRHAHNNDSLSLHTSDLGSVAGYAAVVSGVLASTHICLDIISLPRARSTLALGSRTRGDRAVSSATLLQEATAPKNVSDSNGIPPTFPPELAPEDAASIPSIYTFWWMYPVLKLAQQKGTLDQHDLPMLPKRDTPDELFRRFAKIWKDNPDKKKNPRLLSTLLFRIQPAVFFYSLIHGWVFLGCMFLDPIILKVLLSRAQQDEEARGGSHDLVINTCLVCGLTVSMLIRVSCMEVTFFASLRVMNNARSALVHAVYRKALSMPQVSREFNVGKLTNLMATDADKIGKSSWVIFFLAQWTWALFSLPAVLYFLYQLVGTAAFIALASILIGNWVNKRISRAISPLVRRVQERRDERSALLNELIRGIRLVKLKVWEKLWETRIADSREKELKQLVWQRYLSALNSLVSALVSLAIPVSIFTWYTIEEGRTLDSATAFTALAWIQQMQWSINTLPQMYNLLAYLNPSLERLGEFFQASPLDAWLEEANSDQRLSEPLRGTDTVAHLREATVGYSVGAEAESSDAEGGNTEGAGKRDRPKRRGVVKQKAVVGELSEALLGPAALEVEVVPQVPVLSGVSLCVARGELVVIAGPVGSGKSTLLAALCGAKPLISGQVSVVASRAYVSQKPFLLNGTIRENILFGVPYETARFEDAIARTSLGVDLASLSQGVESMVGESGLQLSGGQKARVALARAIYADAEVLFLDDVLSAVDAHTGHHIWTKCIKEQVMRGKTIVLITHQLQYLSRPLVSRVVVLRDGAVWLNGSWREIASQAGPEIERFVTEGEGEGEGEGGGEGGPSVAGKESKGLEEEEIVPSAIQVTLQECETRIEDVMARFQGRQVTSTLIQEVVAGLYGKEDDTEQRRAGLITWTDFKLYLRVFGSRFTISFLTFVTIAGAVLTVAGNIWLSVWTDGKSPYSQSESLLVYAGIGVGAAVNVALQTIVLTVCALAASRRIHGMMLSRLLAAPMAFFDITPTGRILNRFLQDLQNIDNFVPNAILSQCTKTLNMLTQFTLVIVFAPWVVLATPLVIAPYYYILQRVRVAAREARRIESVAHSPVYGQFGDVLLGRDTVRAFGAEKRFESENIHLIYQMAKGRYACEAVVKWAQALSTQNGCGLYFACGMVCVALNNQGMMTGGQLGLVLLYAAQLQRAMMDYQMGLVDVETSFVSVERIAEYTRIPQEDTDLALSAGKPSSYPRDLTRRDSGRSSGVGTPEADAEWPSRGVIEIDSVSMRYRMYRPLVLDGFSLKIPAGCKVALCGRTGCGKSSLLGVLCRLYPLNRGAVRVDGCDLSTLSLGRVRTALRVVSQDALLISDTLRANLLAQSEGVGRVGSGSVSDTFGEGGSAGVDEHVTDEMLWAILERVGIASQIRTLPNGLDHVVDESGSNFSVGQRQLLTLARELVPSRVVGSDGRGRLQPVRVLLCDEPTANVDLQTDELIHDTLLGLDATMIMICHRLQHLRRFDLVVVVDKGRVGEVGSPAALLADPNSRLSFLNAQAGLM